MRELRTIVEGWGNLYAEKPLRVSQPSMPNIEVVVSPNIQLMRPPEKPSLPPGPRDAVRVERWRFWAAVVVAIIGGVTTYLALRHGPTVAPQMNLPGGK